MKKTFKRIVAALLVAVMLFGSAPIDFLNIKAFAAGFADPVFPIPTASGSTTIVTYGGEPWYYEQGREDFVVFDAASGSYGGHYGTEYRAVDISGYGAQQGATVQAVDDGVVVRVRSGDGSVYIKHTRPLKLYDSSHAYAVWYTVSAHMQNIAVSVGQNVSRGQKIGEVGNVGAGPVHLHFSITTKLYNGNDGFHYGFKHPGAQDEATLKHYSNQTISPMWINSVYRSMNYRRYSNDLADTCALARITGGTENAPTSTFELVTKPAAPSISADKTGDIALGSKVLVKWNAVSGATGYKVYVDGNVKDIGNKNRYSFSADSAGSHSIYVVAYNSQYKSNNSNTVSLKVHPDLKVTFVDWDGTILENPKYVSYGNNVIAPDIPERKGYTFAGWDKPLNKITQDTVIKATYKINKYKIKFLDHENNIISEQNIEYLKNAVAPETPPAPTGYKFFRWESQKYLSVEENATIKGIYVWENEDLPVVAQITSAKRQEDGYYVYFDLTNYPNQTTRGRAIVSLKTSEGKLVDTTESAAFSIPASGTKTGMEVFIPCSNSATVVELIIVKDFSSGIPISQAVVSEVDQALEWSSWSDEKPADNLYSELETRTVYRYRDKEYSTGNSKTKSGWIYAGTYSENEGTWSKWQWEKVTAYDTEQTRREVETRQAEKSRTYKTKYVYTHWHGGWSSIGPYWYNDYSVEHTTGGIDKKLTQTGTTYRPYYGDYTPKYGGWYCTKCGYSTWYNESTYQEVDQIFYGTQYRYRDVSYIYNFYRWLDWSEWSDSAVETTNDRQTETKTQYRYRNQFGDAGVEDNSGSFIDVEYSVDPSFANKQATVLVHKYNEASDWTCEYVGQLTIPEDGKINFSFKPREELSVLTGDYTVSLGIEGTTNTIVVKTIEAPKPEYTVTFLDWDGTAINTQTVTEGGTAICPENVPEREGYDFVGWSTSLTNITSDLEIEARYLIKTYDVIFVDWNAKNIVTKTFEHGEHLVPPETIDVEGYNFVGWNGLTDSETVVTEDMIVTAEYDPEKYEVNIYDFDMNVIGTQTVEHGDYVDLPDELEKSKYIFLGWKSSNDNATAGTVTGDMDVYPVFIFEDTAENPVASVRTGAYTENQFVELSCATEDAVIHYTTDGTDPLTSLSAKLYESPIELTRSTEIKFVASAFEMNDSEVVSEYYAINSDTSTSDWMSYDELPDYVLAKPADYSLESETGYKYKNIIVTSSASEIEALEKDGWTNEGFEYGEQSNWSVSYPELEDAVYEVVEQKPPLVDEMHYEYSHFKYLNSEDGTYSYSPDAIEGVDGVTETIVSPTKLSVANFIPDTTTPYYMHNGEMWFNQNPVIVAVDPGYMMYAYKLKNYTFTKWTEWSVEAPAEDESRETVSDTVYRFTAPEMCIVTVADAFEETEDVIRLGIVGKPLSEISLEELARTGYSVDGLYTDADCTNEWNIESDILSGNITLYTKQSIKTFSVTFLDSDGNVLDVQTVEYGGSATPPEVETQSGYVFVGWDGDGYLFAVDDIEIRAIVKHESEIAKIKLSRSKFRTTVGSAFNLTATVTPETLEDKSVVWSSSDSSVAEVNDEGVVFAVSSGTATITATAFDGASASCVVTVMGDPDSELTLVSSSELVVDDSGYLRNIPIITDESMGTHTAETVADIKREFANESVVIVDMDGETLSDEDSVGTGSVVMLMDGDSVVDSITIIVTGDYDGDGEITNRDAARICRFTVDKEEPNLYQNLAMDVNGDGYVNNRDASMISRYLVGKETI